ncbi:MAG: thiosulfate oxidation carrier protein SoxY [Gammaproteobacteria bacterium]
MDFSHPMNINRSRRAWLAAMAAAGACLTPLAAFASERAEATRKLIAALLGERTAESGGIKLTTPAIAENGNTVPISVEVESPFTAEDYVKAVHIFAEENPTPEVVTFRYTPKSGRAQNSTRIRLARTGRVVAIAELSDGRVLETANEVKVTIGGCGG